MAKIQVNEVTVGQTIKFKIHTNSDGSKCPVPAHTKNADTTTILNIEPSGRYTFLDTTAGQIMIGASGKVTVC